MIRLVPLLLLLSACAAPGSYSLDRGAANYDDLQRASELCRQRGGHIEPTGQGDPYQLSNYTCVIDKKGGS